MSIADNRLKDEQMSEDIEIKSDIVDTEAEVAEAPILPKEDKKADVDDDIVDIDLSAIKKRKFRIDGDNSRLVELNPADISIITRIEEADKKFNKCIDDLEKLTTAPSDTEDEIMELGRKFKDIDNRMRDLLDYVFQSNVSEVCVPEGTGSMYDPINGKFRYDHILDTLLTLYQDNIQSEFKKMNARVNSKTAKYTKNKKR